MTTITTSLHPKVKTANTWMVGIEPDPALRDLSDVELEREARRFPRTINNLSDSDRIRCAQVWMERRHRYEVERDRERSEMAAEYACVESDGQWPNGNRFPNTGETVETTRQGIFGLPIVVRGTAKRRKDGTWYVGKLYGVNAPIAGAKTTPLTNAWRPVCEDN